MVSTKPRESGLSAMRNIVTNWVKIPKLKDFLSRADGRINDAVFNIRPVRTLVLKLFERQMKRFQKELKKNPVVKRAQSVMDDATKQFERGVDSVLEVLNVASRRDLNRIDRKLNQINRKLRGMEQPTPKKQSERTAKAS